MLHAWFFLVILVLGWNPYVGIAVWCFGWYERYPCFNATFTKWNMIHEWCVSLHRFLVWVLSWCSMYQASVGCSCIRRVCPCLSNTVWMESSVCGCSGWTNLPQCSASGRQWLRLIIIDYLWIREVKDSHWTVFKKVPITVYFFPVHHVRVHALVFSHLIGIDCKKEGEGKREICHTDGR